MNSKYNIFINGSVDTGDISDDLSDEIIRQKIRDEYLKDTSVTILLVGTETKHRKYVDWEIYSSMFDGKVNKKSGILVINLPSINCAYFTAPHSGEKEKVYPELNDWITISDRKIFESRYPFMPIRIIDNLVNNKSKISVVNWSKIENNPYVLSFLIDAAYNDRTNCSYDLNRAMRRINS
jgi:hypothetical protein